VLATKKSKADLLKEIDAEYYGYLDDEDYLLLAQEEKCEKLARAKKIEEFKSNLQNNTSDSSEVVMEAVHENILNEEDV
jgi:pre-mRNA-splicing factor ISY1